MVDAVVNPKQTKHEPFQRLMALHKYFLNADYLRDVFMRRIQSKQSPDAFDAVTTMDDTIAMSLWYATVYVVIEGWREVQLSDPQVDALLADDRVQFLKRFRNQVFHYQREYDNPRLLEFLGEGELEARSAANWIGQVHAELGRAIEAAVEDLLDKEGASD